MSAYEDWWNEEGFKYNYGIRKVAYRAALSWVLDKTPTDCYEVIKIIEKELKDTER